MRLLLLVLNILICASLAIKAPELAAATSAKTGKSKSHKLYQAHSRKKTPTNPGDVWTRIRLGMHIPRAATGQTRKPQENNLAKFNALSMSPGYASSALKHPVAPADRQILHSSTTAIECSSPRPAEFRQIRALQNKSTAALLNKKISSRMFHPELRRHIGPKKPRNRLNTAFLHGRPALAKRNHLRHSAKTAALATPCAARTAPYKNRQARINDRINQQIAAYTQNPGFLYRVAERARPYLYHIVEGLSKNRLPLELALLPIVESAYQPTAHSTKNAAGLWQFIPSTGKDFNLEQNRDYDERLDIPESTQAAIRFLSELKAHYKGDWLLALAAYNSGQGTVDYAISRNQAEGLATDFWSLRLPEETQNYVPRLLALSHIFAHPARYGIKLPHVSNQPYFVKVKIDREFDINYLAEKDIGTVARLANLTHEQFSRLNPGYLATRLSRNDSYTFLMPPDHAQQLHQRLAGIAQFMEESGSPVKSLVLTENPPAKMDFPASSLSLGRLLASGEDSDASKCSTAFLSLNVSMFCSKYS